MEKLPQYLLLGLRKKHGISQSQMAEIIGISRYTYQLKETGINQFTAVEMFKISEHFKLPIEKIFVSNISNNDLKVGSE